MCPTKTHVHLKLYQHQIQETKFRKEHYVISLQINAIFSI